MFAYGPIFFLLLLSGMINAGLGETAVNSLLASLNTPGINHRHLKKREREIGLVIEEVAEESCEDALTEEQQQETTKR